MIEALVYEKMKNSFVRCGICQRRCTIAEGKTGFCLTKLNNGGQLFSLNYGLVRGIQLDPIEKKPFYHFKPGSVVPSLGSFGCNFRCRQCLNWWCSWGEPATGILKELGRGNRSQEHLSPEALVTELKKTGYLSVAFTYNEPVIWPEYVLDTARLAKKEGLFTLFVSNGSWTKETLDKVGPFIDAANIDFKGFSDQTYARMGGFFGEIPEMSKYAQEKHHIFIEITTLLIPGVNDDPLELKEMTRWVVRYLGPKTPWHLSRFDPDLAPDKDFKKIPATSVEELKKAASIGRSSGLQFIYIWAPGEDPYYESDTFCPQCKNLVIERAGWQPKIISVDKKGCCSKCRENLNIIL